MVAGPTRVCKVRLCREWRCWCSRAQAIASNRRVRQRRLLDRPHTARFMKEIDASSIALHGHGAAHMHATPSIPLLPSPCIAPIGYVLYQTLVQSYNHSYCPRRRAYAPFRPIAVPRTICNPINPTSGQPDRRSCTLIICALIIDACSNFYHGPVFTAMPGAVAPREQVIAVGRTVTGTETDKGSYMPCARGPSDIFDNILSLAAR